jgi:zinc protease
MRRATILALLVSASAFAKPPEALDRTKAPADGPAPKLELPTPVRMKLASGGDLLVVERHNVPMASIGVVWKVGAATGDPADRPGLEGLVMDLLDEGTAKRGALQLAADLEAIGARLESFSSWDASTVTLLTTTKQLEPALAILADVLTAPAFDEKELERLRAERLTALIQMRDTNFQVANNVLAQLLYGETRYGRPIIGTEAGLKAITRDDVLRFHRERLRPSAATVIVAGDVQPELIKGAIDRALADWKDAGAATPAPALAKATVKPRRAIIDKAGAPQTDLRMGEPSVPRNHPDYFPLQVMNQILGGSFSSRLNMNLREKHGYTYGTRTDFAFRRDGGPFTIAAPVKSEVTAPSLSLVREEIGAIRGAPVTEAELRLAKDQLERALARRFETDAQVVAELAALAVFDLPPDYWSTYAAKVEAVSAADVQRVAKEHLDLSRMSLVLVGDKARIESESAKVLGPFEILDSDGKSLAPPPAPKPAAPKPAPAPPAKK